MTEPRVVTSLNRHRHQEPPVNQSETEIEILAEKIARWARARSAEIERDRRLPDELVTRLREAGLLRATMPREVAAPELAPGRALRCAEAVARGDASAGWCVSIAITSALLVAYLPARSREEMFGGGGVSRRGCGRHVARPGPSTAVSWCPDAGRFAAGSTTRTSCSPAASSTTGKCRRSSR